MSWNISILKAALKLVANARIPKKDGEVKLSRLHAPVEIYHDEWNVPHIYAQNLHDLFLAQGYVHAQERMWQMDFNRRLVAGRLSEILGSVSLPLDRWMRTLTLRRVAEYEENLISEEIRGFYQSYAEGVNNFINEGRLPLEFFLLRYKPEPWKIPDSLSWIKMMSWTLSVNWEVEILRAQLLNLLGPELAAELEPPYLKRWPYVVPPGSDYSRVGLSALDRAKAAKPFTGPSPYEGLGSNNWAISGSLTSTGKPLFANDMHLTMNAPSIWFENHLVAEDFDVTGVIFPGIPGVISGHNGYIAWGYTNGFPDVQDLYMERLRRTTDGQTQAEYKGKWEDVKILHETIEVKGEEPFVEEVIITRHGPIINNLAPDFSGEQPLALQWTSLEPDTMSEVVVEMARARNCHDLHQALRHWTAPVQNVVYADTSGNIAYTFPGKIPIRAKGNGRLPVPGWTDEYEWTGYVPFEDLPHLENPPQGFILSANNQTVSDDYPIRIDLEPISGDRSQRISEMILDSTLRNDEEKIDIAFIRKMHFDQLSPSARIVAHYVGSLEKEQTTNNPQTELDTAIKMFKEWNGTLSSDSRNAALYEVFIRKIVRLMVSSKLEKKGQNSTIESSTQEKQEEHPISILDRFMGKGPTPILADLSLFGERWLPWLTNLLENPDSHWFDLNNGEKRDDTIRIALQLAIDELKTNLGSNFNNWSWGKMHTLTFNHPLASGGKLLEAIFNRGPFPLGGDLTTIWATGTSMYNLESNQVIGPPYRMIVDLDNLDNSLSILVPGQSGHPYARHYDDQVDAWFDNGYHPMLYNRQDIEKGAHHNLKLIPI